MLQIRHRYPSPLATLAYNGRACIVDRMQPILCIEHLPKSLASHAFRHSRWARMQGWSALPSPCHSLLTHHIEAIPDTLYFPTKGAYPCSLTGENMLCYPCHATLILAMSEFSASRVDQEQKSVLNVVHKLRQRSPQRQSIIPSVHRRRRLQISAE